MDKPHWECIRAGVTQDIFYGFFSLIYRNNLATKLKFNLATKLKLNVSLFADDTFLFSNILNKDLERV